MKNRDRRKKPFFITVLLFITATLVWTMCGCAGGSDNGKVDDDTGPPDDDHGANDDLVDDDHGDDDLANDDAADDDIVNDDLVDDDSADDDAGDDDSLDDDTADDDTADDDAMDDDTTPVDDDSTPTDDDTFDDDTTPDDDATPDDDTVQPLAIETVDPPRGGASVNTDVVITGDGFTEGLVVKVGGLPAQSVQVLSSTTAAAVFPSIPLTECGFKDVTLQLND